MGHRVYQMKVMYGVQKKNASISDLNVY